MLLRFITFKMNESVNMGQTTTAPLTLNAILYVFTNLSCSEFGSVRVCWMWSRWGRSLDICSVAVVFR